MNELEVKILEINKEILIKKILWLWAQQIFSWEIQAVFLKNNDWKKIRIRKMGGANILSYKNKIANNDWIMKNEEYEVRFSEYENLLSIFKNIGFDIYGKSTKFLN